MEGFVPVLAYDVLWPMVVRAYRVRARVSSAVALRVLESYEEFCREYVRDVSTEVVRRIRRICVVWESEMTRCVRGGRPVRYVALRRVLEVVLPRFRVDFPGSPTKNLWCCRLWHSLVVFPLSILLWSLLVLH